MEKAAAIAYRIENGELLVALVTARSDGRWVLPKGSVEPGELAHKAAAREAAEEAGVIVSPIRTPLGRCLINKISRQFLMGVYAMPVIEVLDEWDEAHVRQRRWATPRDAAMLVREPTIKRILCQLEERLRLAA